MSRTRGTLPRVVVTMLASLLLASCASLLAPPSTVALDTARLLEMVNEARSTETDCGSYGVYPPAPPLVLESRLSAAAQEHTFDMQERGFISHTGSDGSTVGDRIERQGYSWAAWGENVASGFGTAESVMAAWLDSPGHCANVMRDRYTELGIGRVGLFWTQVFARPM